MEFTLDKGVRIGDALWTAIYNHVKEQYNIVEIFENTENTNNKSVFLKSEDKYYRLNFTVDENMNCVFEEEVIEVTDSYTPCEEPQFSQEEVENFVKNFEKNLDEDNKGNDEENHIPMTDPEEEPKGISYNLEEIPEYVELLNKYSSLEESYNSLVSEHAAIIETNNELTKFKAQVDKKAKETLIKSFYMLDEEDKKDVIENIDSYSLEEIESKLSVICVRKRVSFACEEEDNTSGVTTYNINDAGEDASTPAWVKAAMAVAKTMN